MTEKRIAEFIADIDVDSVLVFSKPNFTLEDAKDYWLMDGEGRIEVVEIIRPLQQAISVLTDVIDEGANDERVLGMLETLGSLRDYSEDGYQSELDFVSRCILDRKHIETGGQLFGFWTSRGDAFQACRLFYHILVPIGRRFGIISALWL